MTFYSMPQTQRPVHVQAVAPDKYRPSVKRFGYVLLTSAIVSYVPNADLWTVPLVLALFLFVVPQIVSGQVNIFESRTFAAVLLVAQCFLSMFVLFYNGYSIDEWSKAVAPFSFFLLLLFLPRLTKAEQEGLAKTMFYAGLIWGVKIFGDAVWLAWQGSDVFHVRLTFRVIDSVIVFPLILIPYLLFVPFERRNWIRVALIAAVMGMYLWIGYRAGLVFITLPFFIYVALQTKKLNFAPLILLVFVVYAAVVSINSDMFGLGDRFSKIDEEAGGARGYEWEYAISNFLESPIIGKGLGWQVPTIYVVDDDPNFVPQTPTVGFVHSAIAYFGMDMGILGIINYYFLTLPRYYRRDRRDLQKFAGVAMLLLTMFCLTQAAFRTIHTVFLMIALIRINALPVDAQTSMQIRPIYRKSLGAR